MTVESKHIGILACSYEGAALCYRTICLEAQDVMGEDIHPEITLHNFSLGEYMRELGEKGGGWPRVAQMMIDSCRKLQDSGADLIVCPDNTIHQVYDPVAASVAAQWIHIVDAVGREAISLGLEKLAVLGTGFLMDGPVYPDRLTPLGIERMVPEAAEREGVDRIIFKELVKGEILDSSRKTLCDLIEKMKARGCDGVVLGCTELPLIVTAEDSALPVLDSTRLLARAALEAAVI